MRPIRILTSMLLATTVASTLRAQAPDPLTLAEKLRAEIQTAWLSGDRARMDAALKTADRATVLYPKDGLLRHYFGYAVYRHVQLQGTALSDESRRAWLVRGLEALDAANRLSPMAESYVLRWSLLAQTISDAGSAMAVVTPMQEELAQAMRLGKDNPRVWLVNGAGTFFTPEMWGGGADAALAHLKKADALFAVDHPARAMPDWGRAETWAWIGVAHQKLGHTEESRRAYQEALRLEPAFVWVKDVLLPGLEKGIQPFP